MQCRFRVDYISAEKIIDRLEETRVIGPYEGNKPRVVLIKE
ncbi:MULTISPECIES: DNA translocase FtsK [Bacillus]|nr:MULTISPECIES: DNA translocase FtsK [Bacillus]